MDGVHKGADDLIKPYVEIVLEFFSGCGGTRTSYTYKTAGQFVRELNLLCSDPLCERPLGKIYRTEGTDKHD